MKLGIVGDEPDYISHYSSIKADIIAWTEKKTQLL